MDAPSKVKIADPVERYEQGTFQASDFTQGDGKAVLAIVGTVFEAGRVSVHRLAQADAVVDKVFIRRRGAFASSALRAFLACAASGFTSARAA